MRTLTALAIAALTAAAATAQSTSLTDWLQRRVPQPQRTTVQQVIERARADGRIQTNADLVAIKQAFRQLRGKDRRARPEWQRADSMVWPATPSASPEAVTLEHEDNDAWSWADGLGTNRTASGSNAARLDLDTFHYLSTGADFVTFTVVANGTAPILDSTITLRAGDGAPVAFADLVGTESLSLFLPAGDFHVEVGAWVDVMATTSYGGTYDLQITTQPVRGSGAQTLTANGANGTTQAISSPNHDVFAFSLAADSTVNLAVTSNNIDTVLVVQRTDGGVWFVGDDNSVGIDGRADLDLPAGNYFAYVSEVSGGGGSAYSLAFSATPLAIPDLATASSQGSLLGSESLRLFAANLPGPRRIDFATNAGTIPPVNDTVLGIYDRHLGYLVDCDDDDLNLHGHYSRVHVSLPMANYFVAVAPFPAASGNFTVGGSLAPFAAVGQARYGHNALAIGPAANMNTYVLANGTAAAVRLYGDDYNYNVIGPTGLLAGTLPGQDWYAQATDLAAGDHYVVCFDRFAFQGPLGLDLLPPLRVIANTLTSSGKEGDLALLLATFNPPTTGINLGFGDSGYLLLSPGPGLATVGFRGLNANGKANWFPLPANTYGILLQSLDLHTGLNWTPAPVLTWRNALQL